MQASSRMFRIALIAVLLLVSISGLLYAYFYSIPAPLAAPLVVSFALEAAFYLAPGFDSARSGLERRFRPPALAALMAASAVAPYLAYAPVTGMFRWTSLAELAGLAALVSFWYVVMPRRPAVNLVFIAMVAAVLLANPFAAIYGTPAPWLKLGVLGQLMWTRLAILAALSLARMEVHGFGFWPNAKEAAAGVLNFALFAPMGVLLGWATGVARFNPRGGEWWQAGGIAIATFAGMFWVVGLREEFFFRGLLQEWLSKWSRSEWGGLVTASVLFGLVHLPFRGFPNWRFVLLATVAGFFYGRAYLAARSIRAAMITHALVTTTWQILFR